MSMHGSAVGLATDAVACLREALGGQPINIGALGGDDKSGVRTGPLLVRDQPHPEHAAVRLRCVSVDDNPRAVYSVLVASSDVLTHVKAENVLRSLASLTGVPVCTISGRLAVEGPNLQNVPLA